MFFDGIAPTDLILADGPLPGSRFRLRMAGSGPAVLLLHGAMQTHAMWHAVGPLLARRHTIICPDLRGHGGSVKPPASPDHAAHGATAMAADMRALMHQLLPGQRFVVAGHGRGAIVALALGLAAADQVRGLAALDAVPDTPMPCDDMAASLGQYKGLWFFEPRPLAEQVVSLSPDVWFKTGDAGQGGFFAPEALADYLAAANDPAAMTGLREGLRAAATLDRLDQAVARGAGRRLACPVRVQWGQAGRLGGWYDPRARWREVTGDASVTGTALPGGHYLAEQVPDLVAADLAGFMAGLQ